MNYIEDLIRRYPVLQNSQGPIKRAYKILGECYEQGGKLLIAGNGGSASDAEHIVGELMKGFMLSRSINNEFGNELKKVAPDMGEQLAERLQGALPAVALHNHNSLNTAITNDVDGTMCFAQQIMGYGKREDIFWGISTSGNSQNILYAAAVAKAKGMRVLGLTGEGGGRLARFCDVLIDVPEKETYKVQELHLPIYHCLCRMLEARFWG